MREAARLIEEGYTFKADADLQSYFDTIPHEQWRKVEERISDRRVLSILPDWLAQDILRNMER